jgi:type IV secretory pathway VirB4 component
MKTTSQNYYLISTGQHNGADDHAEFCTGTSAKHVAPYWKANDTFMVYSPTGSGKTGLAAFIVAGFVSRGMRVCLCTVHHPDRSDG